MKRFFLYLFTVVLFSVAAVDFYAVLCDDRISEDLISDKYKKAEDVADNAAIDLSSLLRPEKMSVGDVYSRWGERRASHNTFHPEQDKPLFAKDELMTFKGISWLYTCWIVPYPAQGPCLQPFSFEYSGMEINRIFLNRYENALERKNFAADGFFSFDEDSFGVAMLYMASAGYYFSKDKHVEAIKIWRKNHEALIRFLRGTGNFSSTSALLNLYSMSLAQAERFIINGVSGEDETTVKQVIGSFSPDEINPSDIARNEISARRDELLREFRPSWKKFLSPSFINRFKPMYINRSLNRLSPVISEYEKLSEMPFQDALDIINKSGSSDNNDSSVNRAPVPDTLSDALMPYMKSGMEIIIHKAAVSAQHTAFLLSLALKESSAAGNDAFTALAVKKEFLNPLTGKPFELKNGGTCIEYSIRSQKYCVSVINGTPVNIK